jgi:hypothetical protein
MEGIWLLLVFIVALASICVLAGMRPGITKSRHCPSCETPMSLRRVPLLKSHALLGAWECPHCGSRSKSGTAA